MAFEALEDRRILAASGLEVTTTLDVVDPGDDLNSLREAIIYANETPGPDTITLPAGLYQLAIAGRDDAPIGGSMTIMEGADVSIASCLIGDNSDMRGLAPDVRGTVVSRGYNLIEKTSGAVITGDTTGNVLGQDPRLAALADNGGATLTHALLAGSPALNTAHPAIFPATDQRGVARPQGPAPDIGAFESEEFKDIFLSINDVSVIEGMAAVFTITLSAPTSQIVTFRLEARDGTANGVFSHFHADDYGRFLLVGSLTFAPLQASQNVTVGTIDDTGFEPDETFFVDLSDATNATIADGQGLGTIINDDPPASPLVTGADLGGGPHVRVFDGSGEEHLSFFAFHPAFTGGVRVTTGDVTGDGTPDIIAAAGPGGGPHVRVFDGITGEQVPGAIGSFYAYDPAFTGGVFVASADFDGDGLADILTGPGIGGGPHVRVFSGRDGADLVGFFDNSKGDSGVRVATGDIDGDGTPDIIASMGPGGVGPGGVPDLVRVFSGTSGQEVASGAGRISAYPGFGGGVYVAGGDVNGDGRDDVITGAGAGGGPHVRAFSGVDGSELASFFAYSAAFTGGVRVGVGDVDQDGDVEIITGAGPGGGPHVRAFDVLDDGEVASFFAFDPAFGGGVFVAGSPFSGNMPNAGRADSSQAVWLNDDIGQAAQETASTVESDVQPALSEVDVDHSRDLVFTGPDSLSDDWSADEELEIFHASSWPELADLLRGSDDGLL